MVKKYRKIKLCACNITDVISNSATYFNVSTISPSIRNNCVCFYDGENDSRSWGRCWCNNTILFASNNYVIILLAYHHKYGGGQSYYYYAIREGAIVRLRFNQLSLQQQSTAVNAYENDAPNWAKAPCRQDRIARIREEIQHVSEQQEQNRKRYWKGRGVKSRWDILDI